MKASLCSSEKKKQNKKIRALGNKFLPFMLIYFIMILQSIIFSNQLYSRVLETGIVLHNIVEENTDKKRIDFLVQKITYQKKRKKTMDYNQVNRLKGKAQPHLKHSVSPPVNVNGSILQTNFNLFVTSTATFRCQKSSRNLNYNRPQMTFSLFCY